MSDLPLQPEIPTSPGPSTTPQDDPLFQYFRQKHWEPEPPPYEPTYWEDPWRVARYQHVLESTPPGASPPEWIDPQQINQAYEYLRLRHHNSPWYAWKHLPADDPARQFLQSLPTPPEDALWPGEERFAPPPPLPEPEIGLDVGGLSDAQYDELPLWQKAVMAILGSPKAAGATIGGTLGLAGGPVGAAAGAVLGGTIGGLSERYPGLAGWLMKLDYPAEWLERALGVLALGYGRGIEATRETGRLFGADSGASAVADVLGNLRAAWQAAHLTYESVPVGQTWQLGEPEPREQAAGFDALEEAYERIRDGEAPDSVYQDMNARLGFSGQAREMLGHVILDPLNVAPLMLGSEPLQLLAKITGNETLATAARSTRGAGEAIQQYGVLLRTTTPVEDISKMDAITRWIAGVTKEGTVRALDVTPPTRARKAAGAAIGATIGGAIGLGLAGPVGASVLGGIGGLAGWGRFLTPATRATEIVQMGALDLAMLLERAQGDPDTMVKFVHSVANTPADLARELSMNMLEAPEAAALPLMLRDQLPMVDQMLAGWKATEWSRSMLDNIAAVTKRTPAQVLQELSDTRNAEVLLRQYTDAARAAGNTDILRAVESGELSAGSLQSMTRTFTTGGLPINADQFRGQLYAGLIEQSAQWAAKYFNVQPDPAWIRLSKTVKSAQSLMLLGLNPTYFINNAVNNIVTSAATGVFGLRSQASISRIWQRVGFTPERLRAGIGAAGEGEINIAAIRQATQAPGALTKVDDLLRSTSNKLGLFSNLSAKVEAWSSAQAYTSGFLQAWGRLWRRGVGYDPLPGGLERSLASIDPDLPGLVYDAIQGGMNQAEVEAALASGVARRSLDAYLPEAAAARGMSEADVREVLIHSGVDDLLRDRLAKAETDDQVRQVFRDVSDQVQRRLDEQARETLDTERASAQARVTGEGAQAAVEILDNMSWELTEHWYGHFVNMRRAAQEAADLRMLGGDAGMVWETAYRAADRDWTRINRRQEAQLLGMAEGLGLDSAQGQNLTARLVDIHELWREFYAQRLARMDDVRTGRMTWDEAQAALSTAYEQAYLLQEQHYQLLDQRIVDMFVEKWGDQVRQPAEAWRAGIREIRAKMHTDMAAARADEVQLDRFIRDTYLPEIRDLFEANRSGIQAVQEAAGGPALELRPAPQAPEQLPLDWQLGGSTINPPEVRRPEMTIEQRGRMTEARAIGSEFGLATADEAGNYIPGSDRHLLNIVNKYGSQRYADLADADPAVVRAAFERRRAAQEAVESADETLLPTPTPVEIQQEELEVGMRRLMDQVTQRDRVRARLAEMEARLTREPALLSAGEQRQLLYDGLRQIFELPEDQARAVIEVTDARAQTWAKRTGRTPAEWYQTRIKGIAKGSPEGALPQAAQKGAVTIAEDGGAIIYAMRSPDVSTAVHEIGRIFRRDLGREDLKVAEQWAGVKDGAWQPQHEEKFARAFERYLADGQAPVEGLAGVFEQLKRWLLSIYNRLAGVGVEISPELRGVFDRLLTDEIRQFEAGQGGQVQMFRAEEQRMLRGAVSDTGPKKVIGKDGQDTLFQDADGTIDRAPLGGEPPDPAGMNLGEVQGLEGTPPLQRMEEESWNQIVWPLLRDIEQQMLRQGRTSAGRVELDPRTSAELRAYLNRVYGQMADTKLASIRWAENRRDAALLNYGRRYEFDNVFGAVFPYQFWYTRSALQWAVRAIDRPGWLANYARIRDMQENTVASPGFPTRLRGKMRIPVPFLPEWAGGAVYIDPWHQVFPFEQLARPFMQYAEQQGEEMQRAVYILQGWIADEQISARQAQEAINQKAGPVWEKAVSQAQVELDSEVSNPWDFASLISGPSLPIGIAYNLARGRPDRISQLPAARMVQSVTAWMKPGGVDVEAPLRRAVGLPGGNRFEDYFVDRELANMAATGEIDVDAALLAMVERGGPVFEQALQRVGRTQSARHLGSFLWADIFPEGEQRQRSLQQVFSAAIDSGDPAQITEFFEKYPEYRARLSMSDWENPEERLKQFLVSQVWEGYRELPALQQRQVREQLGDLFNDAFLNKETRSYDAIDNQTLAAWAQVMGRQAPATMPQPAEIPVEFASEADADAYQRYLDVREQKFPGIGSLQGMYFGLPDEQREEFMQSAPELSSYWNWRNRYLADHPAIIPYVTSEESELAGAPVEVAQVVYDYRAQRIELFGEEIFDIQSGYFDLPERSQARRDYLKRNPQLKAYWDWKDEFEAQHPGAVPYISGGGESGSWIDTGSFSPALVRSLVGYYHAGGELGSGARKSIQRIWEQAGRPGENLDEFIDQVLRPYFD